MVSGVRQWTKLTHVGPGYNWDWRPSSSGYTISGCNQPTRSTQPCIPPGSLNRVASAGLRAGMSPLPGGKATLCDPMWHVSSCSSVATLRTAIHLLLTYLLTHTHTRLMALFPGLPGWAGTRKVKPVWILLKQETVSGSSISWEICKSEPRSREITTQAPHHSVFTGRTPFLPPKQQRQITEGKTATFSKPPGNCNELHLISNLTNFWLQAYQV